MNKRYLVKDNDIYNCLYINYLLIDFRDKKINLSRNQKDLLYKIFNGYLDLIERCQNEYKNQQKKS